MIWAVASFVVVGVVLVLAAVSRVTGRRTEASAILAQVSHLPMGLSSGSCANLIGTFLDGDVRIVLITHDFGETAALYVRGGEITGMSLRERRAARALVRARAREWTVDRTIAAHDADEQGGGDGRQR